MRASPSSAQGRYLDTVDNSKVDIYVDTVDIYTEKCMSSPLHGWLSPLLLQLIAVKKCHEMGFTADPGHGVLLTADTANCEHLVKQILICFHVLIIPCLLFPVR